MSAMYLKLELGKDACGIECVRLELHYYKCM